MSGGGPYDVDDDDDDDEGGPDPDDEWGDDEGDDFMDDLLESRVCGCGARIRWRRAFVRRPNAAWRRVWIVDTPCRDDNLVRESHLVRGGALVMFGRAALELLDEYANEVTLEDVTAWRQVPRFDA